MSAARLRALMVPVSSLLLCGAVFLAFVLWERPGYGIGHLYYVPIALFAITSGPWAGTAMGAFATGVFALGVLLNDGLSNQELLTVSLPIRFVTFVALGALLGWFAKRHRALTAELRVLAERDALTGLPNTRAFEAAITRRLAASRPFALLVGDLGALALLNDEHGRPAGDEVLRRLADLLAASTAPNDDVARVGGDEFAVLTECVSLDEAARLATRLEHLLADEGCAITFGWSCYPQEGDNALALYRGADERLYARKLMRRGERPRELAVVRSPAAQNQRL